MAVTRRNIFKEIQSIICWHWNYSKSRLVVWWYF